MNRRRWLRLMTAFDLPPNLETYDRLVEAYSERHRHYHTVAHVDDCLAKLDRFQELAETPHQVEMAMWFHDAVYRPLSSANELQSAHLARDFLASQGVPDASLEHIHGLILATTHHAPVTTHDAAVMVDVDLSILGEPPDVYDSFEDAVRKEYRWVPSIVYRNRRANLLGSFLERERLYENEAFVERYEATARVNLRRAIDQLTADR